MADDDLTAELDRIAEDIEATVSVYNLDGAGKNSYPVSAAMIRHARPLLAALRAVLELADNWDAGLAGGSLHPHARAIRKAIARELTGKGESDGQA